MLLVCKQQELHHEINSGLASLNTYTYLPTPTGLSLTTAGSDSLSISWNAVAGSGITYDAEYCVKASCDSTSIGGEDLIATSTVISSLEASTEYRVRVRSKTTVRGTTIISYWAGWVDMTTLGDALDTPDNFRSTASTATTISFAWDQVTGADGYIIEYCDADDCQGSDEHTVTGGTTTSTTISSLTPGIRYSLTIVATSTTSTDSAASTSIYVTTLDYFRLLSRTGTTVTLGWEDETTGAEDYTNTVL